MGPRTAGHHSKLPVLARLVLAHNLSLKVSSQALETQAQAAYASGRLGRHRTAGAHRAKDAVLAEVSVAPNTMRPASVWNSSPSKCCPVQNCVVAVTADVLGPCRGAVRDLCDASVHATKVTATRASRKDSDPDCQVVLQSSARCLAAPDLHC